VHELEAVWALVWRDLKRFGRDRSQVLGSLARPVVWLLFMGKGMRASVGSVGGLDYQHFIFAGSIAMTVLFGGMFQSITIIWDREFGFLKEVLVAPVPRWAVAVGKSFGGATVALVQVAILICIGPLVGISLSVLIVAQMLFLGFLMSVAVTSLGVIVASRMTSMASFQMVMNFLVMPLYFLSGAMFPMSSAPAWMKALMSADPLTYGVDAIRNVMFSGTAIAVEGTSRSLVDVARAAGLVRWPLPLDIAAMTLAAVILTATGAWVFSKSQAA